MASKEVVLQRLQELLPKANLREDTTNSILKRLSEELGQDVSEYRRDLKAVINEYLLQHPDIDAEEDEQHKQDGRDSKATTSEPAAKNAKTDTSEPAANTPNPDPPAKSIKSDSAPKKVKPEPSKASKPNSAAKSVKAEPPAKKAKTEAGAKATSSGPSAASPGTGGGADVIDMGERKRVTVSEFKGCKYVDLREWYEKDGEFRPGKKGVALPVEGWEKLCEVADKVTAAAEQSDDKFEVQLARTKKVSISKFNGRTFVDVREFYEKDGKSLPGKKGLSMRLDQWSKLVEGKETINRQL